MPFTKKNSIPKQVTPCLIAQWCQDEKSELTYHVLRNSQMTQALP